MLLSRSILLLTTAAIISMIRAQFSERFANTDDFNVWMPTNYSVRFTVVIPFNNYFAIGYGLTMFNTDMVIWEANGANSTALDLYSTGEVAPTVD